MTDLRKLINQFPELGDCFAEWENRISFLENSLPYSRPPEPQPAQEPEVWKPRAWDRLQQLEARVLHIEKKSMEQRAERAKRKQVKPF